MKNYFGDYIGNSIGEKKAMCHHVTWTGCCWSNVGCLAKSYTCNISCTLVVNKIVNHSDVVQLHLHSRLNIWLQGIRQRQPQDSTRIFKCWDLVHLILEIWRYIKQLCMRSCLKMSQINTDTATIMQKTHFYSQVRKKFWLPHNVEQTLSSCWPSVPL